MWWGATVAAQPQRKKSSALQVVVAGDAANYELELRNVCLERKLSDALRLVNTLTDKWSSAYKDIVDMLLDRLGRFMCEKGCRDFPERYLEIPTAMLFGEQGFMCGTRRVTGVDWSVDDTSEYKRWDMKLDNRQFALLAGPEKAIRKRKNGEYFMVALYLWSVLDYNKAGLLKKKAKINGKITKRTDPSHG